MDHGLKMATMPILENKRKLVDHGLQIATMPILGKNFKKHLQNPSFKDPEFWYERYFVDVFVDVGSAMYV